MGLGLFRRTCFWPSFRDQYGVLTRPLICFKRLCFTEPMERTPTPEAPDLKLKAIHVVALVVSDMGVSEKSGVPEFFLGVLITRILLYRVLYWDPLFLETPTDSHKGVLSPISNRTGTPRAPTPQVLSELRSVCSSKSLPLYEAEGRERQGTTKPHKLLATPSLRG